MLVNRKKCYILSFLLLTLVVNAKDDHTDQLDCINELIYQSRKFLYNDIDRTIELLARADSLTPTNSSPKLTAKVANEFAFAYYVKGSYNNSLKYYLIAHENYSLAKDHTGLAKTLIGRGLVLQGIDHHQEAITLFHEAIKKYHEANESSFAAPAYLNIAISKLEQKEFEIARKNLNKALDLAKKSNQTNILHLGWNKLAELYFCEGNFDEALRLYFKVLKNKDIPNNWEKSFAHAGLAQTYGKLEKYSKALLHGHKALEFALQTESLWDLERNTKILSNIYEAIGNHEEALVLLKKNQGYRDSLYNQKKLRQINLLQLENRKNENLRLNAEKKNVEQKLLLNRAGLSILLIALIILLMFFKLYKKNINQRLSLNAELENKNSVITRKNKLITKRNKELNKANDIKNQMFAILSHDLKTPLNSLQQLTTLLRTEKFEAEEKNKFLIEMELQVKETTKLLNNLLIWSNSQMNGLKTKIKKTAFVKKVEEAIEVHTLNAKNKNIKLKHEKPNTPLFILVDEDQLSIILNNLLSNAIKYTIIGGEIKLSYKIEPNSIKLTILDEGMGVSELKIREIFSSKSQITSQPGTYLELGTGIGLSLVKQFLKNNNATLDIKTYPSKGSAFSISFLPIKF